VKFPLPTEEGSREEDMPLPQTIFLTSEWKMVRFGAFWLLFLQTNFLQIVPYESLKLSPIENSYVL